MDITWYGHSNIRFRSQYGSILVDPFFEGNPKAPDGYECALPVDVVLVTHDHGDHVGQAVEVCKACKARLVTIFDTACALTGKGLPQDLALGMNIGGTVEVKGMRFKMVQAAHSSATGAAAGFIVTLPDGYCFYHAGDTGLFSSMELFSRFHDIRLAMLPIGGWFTMDAEQAAHACAMLRCASVIPLHWGTFPILAQNTSEFRDCLKRIAPKTSLLELSPGEPLPL